MRKQLKNHAAWILLAGAVFLCWLFVMQYGIFGSKVDWISQHSVLPDYFRQRFYDTGSSFPDFAWNLGGGQNIYNFSYYGLFSPVILFSYLLPFVEMDIYIMGSSIAAYGISVVFFYGWLCNKKLPFGSCFLGACMFALSAPLLYHSYNQLMFVNYMPFLCLGLLGVDRHFEKGKSGLLILGSVGMILTSFYFSIGGLAALAVYGVSVYLNRDEISVKGFLKEGIRFLVPLMAAVFLCGVLLLPTGIALLSGRQGGQVAKEPVSLLGWYPLRFLYSPYGLGLSAFSLVGLMGGVLWTKKWKERFLPLCLIGILTIPLFGYLLNGGLYSKDKVFIPFLPLVCLVVILAEQQLSLKADGICKKVLRTLPYAVMLLLLYSAKNQTEFSKYWFYAFVEGMVLVPVCFAEKKIRKIPLSLFASCVVLFFSGWMINKTAEKMIPLKEYEGFADKSMKKIIEETLADDKSWYRMEQYGNAGKNKANINRVRNMDQNLTSMYSSIYNQEYQRFRNETFMLNEPFRNNMMESMTDNPCFLQFMGVRYLIGSKAPDGYEKIQELSDVNLYKAETPAPLGYVTNRTISEKTYKSLIFPQNQTALLERAVVPDEKDSVQSAELSSMRACEINLPEEYTDSVSIRKTDDGYEIEVSKKKAVLTARIEGAEQSSALLAVLFEVENEYPKKDMYIKFMEQTNRLSADTHEYANHNTSFSYLLSPGKGVKEIPVTFGRGKYKIKNLKAFSGNVDREESRRLYRDEMTVLEGYPKGDVLKGRVHASEDGYFITSIPYDENIRILIDKKETELVKVNTAFCGARISAGEHEIEIVYKASGKYAGFLFLGAGILICLVLWKKKQI